MCFFFHLISNSWVMSIFMLSHVLSHVTILKESERLFKIIKIQIPNWRLDFFGVCCSGFSLFFFVSFLFLFWFGYKMYIWLSNYKKKKRDHTNFCCIFFFGKSDKLFFFKPQLRIHNINNAYLIALDNCYYVKIKLDCVYLFLNISK